MADSTLSVVISLYILIFLFVIVYSNKEKIKRILFGNPKKERYVKICPKCKSENVSPDFSLRTFGEQSEFNKYKCNNCGHSSVFFPEQPKSF